MIELFTGIENRAIVTKSIALTHRIHAAVTSDRAKLICSIGWEAIKTVFLLTIAAYMFAYEMGWKCRAIVEAHKNEDLTKLATDKIEAVAATVKVWVKGQRDRAASLVKSTADALETAARVRVSRLGLMISDRALSECPGGMCPVNLDEV